MSFVTEVGGEIKRRNKSRNRGCSIFVEEVSFVSDRFAETERENNAQDLNGDHTDSHNDDYIQVTYDEIVDSLVASLKEIRTRTTNQSINTFDFPAQPQPRLELKGG